MRNCLNCKNAYGEYSREIFCIAFNTYVFIPLEDHECSEWVEKNINMKEKNKLC